MFYVFLTFLIALFPAQAGAAIDNIQDLLVLSVDLFQQLVYVVFGFALLTFFWGLAKFILNASDAKSHEDGRRLMVWGIIALFVMVSIWGIIGLLQDDLGIF